MRWIHSARFDLSLFLGPPVAAVLLVLALPGVELPVWGWLLLVVGIDVAHVYASLYRTYFDRAELARRPLLYGIVPPACWAAGILLYSVDPMLFWRALAYLAVFHFVRQQYGFLMLYRHRAGETGRLDAWIDKAAVYWAMLYPLLFWHADGARVFAWFVPGDFVRLPETCATAGLWISAAALTVFFARQVLRRAPFNWGKIGVVASTAATWAVGIVFFNSDVAFTLTNVVAHGVPYLALVWLVGRRKWSAGGSWLSWVHRPAALGVFVGLLLALAWIEEGVWDLLVWKEHAAAFFGLATAWSPPPLLLSFLVPLLALPQAAHYVLDGWIWRFDGSNPGLREQVFGPEPPLEASPKRPLVFLYTR